MSAVCPSHEVDELTISLLTIYESRGLSMQLIEALIEQEIEDTGLYHISSCRGFVDLTPSCRK
jgi:hypothetical protein